jgi:BirA family biotin operon repressor/biotin-[acetyl-CoA-carboxylase] ligase
MAGPASPADVRWFEEITSTNDAAREAALAGEPDGRWFLARRQTAGRGRQGRSWQSPAGNFHGSLLLRTDRDLAEAASLSLVAALAVAEAVHVLGGGRLVPRLKWPNDILLGGAKLAGILLEGGRAATGSWVVIGIGINLAHHPLDIRYPATSLAKVGLEVAPADFLGTLRQPLARRIGAWRTGGFAVVRRAWLDAALGLGSEVALRVGEFEHRGRFADLGADGSILIENRMGCLERFTAGELFFALQEAPLTSLPGS